MAQPTKILNVISSLLLNNLAASEVDYGDYAAVRVLMNELSRKAEDLNGSARTRALESLAALQQPLDGLFHLEESQGIAFNEAMIHRDIKALKECFAQ